MLLLTQRVTAMLPGLSLVRRVNHTADSASVLTACLVDDVITVCPASIASHLLDACVRTQRFISTNLSKSVSKSGHA